MCIGAFDALTFRSGHFSENSSMKRAVKVSNRFLFKYTPLFMRLKIYL